MSAYQISILFFRPGQQTASSTAFYGLSKYGIASGAASENGVGAPAIPRSLSTVSASCRKLDPAPISSSSKLGSTSPLKLRTRRGGKKRKRSFKNIRFKSDLKIYHLNVCGFDSKSESLNSILGIVRPGVVTLNETHYKHNRKVKIKGYKTFQKIEPIRVVVE